MTAAIYVRLGNQIGMRSQGSYTTQHILHNATFQPCVDSSHQSDEGFFGSDRCIHTASMPCPNRNSIHVDRRRYCADQTSAVVGSFRVPELRIYSPGTPPPPFYTPFRESSDSTGDDASSFGHQADFVRVSLRWICGSRLRDTVASQSAPPCSVLAPIVRTPHEEESV